MVFVRHILIMSEFTLFDSNRFAKRRMRLATLTNTRWIAVLGQSLALLVVAGYFQFPFPVTVSFCLIALSGILNLVLIWLYPANKRLSPLSVASVLAFDIAQLSALLYLTGGLENPFSVLLIAPVIISAATLPLLYTGVLGGSVVFFSTLLAFQHMPLPWYPERSLYIPPIFIAGVWGAVLTSVAFTAFYIYRVASEARSLADALAETELVLQRETHLTALDGLAAAAAHELGTPLATISLVVKEMDNATNADHPLKEDIALLRGQADRCREILSRIATLNSGDEAPISQLNMRALLEEIAAPHREFGVEIRTGGDHDLLDHLIVNRSPAINYGLGNFVENAVDFAHSEVLVTVERAAANIRVTVMDDGPGFAPEQLEKLGEPDVVATRGAQRSRAGSEGLGLGIFIAKTLLERSGARIVFKSGEKPLMGACVQITWPKASIESSAGGF